jgi:hypothetical protein
MTVTHSTNRWSRSSLRGHPSAGTRSLEASPDPSAAQKRPGNICASVAMACAMCGVIALPRCVHDAGG